jgi:membrane-bound ClpP family serine protease
MIDRLGPVLAQATESGGWGSSPLLAAALLLLGFVFIVAEVFTMSFGFFTLCTLACFVGGLAVAYAAGTGWFIGSLAGVAVGAPVFVVVMLKSLPHTRLGRKLIPENPKAEDVTASGADGSLPALAGKEGRTLGMCRPVGVAEIDGQRYDVIAEGMPINPGVRVKVVLVEGNRVVVREIQ